MPPKIILDLCGGTGSWSRPWQLNGYDVRIITLPFYDVLTYEPPDNVWGILAAPPCTEFSVLNCIAENRERDFDVGMEIVNGLRRLIFGASSISRLSCMANGMMCRISCRYISAKAVVSLILRSCINRHGNIYRNSHGMASLRLMLN